MTCGTVRSSAWLGVAGHWVKARLMELSLVRALLPPFDSEWRMLVVSLASLALALTVAVQSVSDLVGRWQSDSVRVRRLDAQVTKLELSARNARQEMTGQPQQQQTPPKSESTTDVPSADCRTEQAAPSDDHYPSVALPDGVRKEPSALPDGAGAGLGSEPSQLRVDRRTTIGNQP